MVALIAYSALASMHWMFVEGAYLTLKLSCFAMASDGSQIIWWLFGWGWHSFEFCFRKLFLFIINHSGLPVIWVSIWVVLLETYSSSKFCWLPYTKSNSKWVVLAPMLTCLAVSFINTLFMKIKTKWLFSCPSLDQLCFISGYCGHSAEKNQRGKCSRKSTSLVLISISVTST